MKKILIFVLFCTALAGAQMPVPALPQTFIDTTWNPPTGGTTRAVHSAATLQSTLNAAVPGDIIMLDAGVTYTGNFTLPAKSNPNRRWIYIESTKIANFQAPGNRVFPSTWAFATIVTPNTSPAISVAAGATNYRLVGMELTSASTVGCHLSNTPPINCFSYFLLDTPVTTGLALPDSITVDRCYIHGSNTQDVGHAVVANATNIAIIDSYISDIHESTFDSQAILAYATPGPIKIVDNYLSATTEDVMFGGAGAPNNTYVPSDIEIRRNLFFKPMAWKKRGTGGTMPPLNQWVVKDNLELKSARRVLVTGNTMQNVWLSGQTGFSIVLTPRPSDSGNNAVVDDITIQSNLLTGVSSGVNTLETDNLCQLPQCTNPGEEKRVWIDNNLLLLVPDNIGATHMGFLMAANLTDFAIQHNTLLMSDQSNCYQSIYFGLNAGQRLPMNPSDTQNVWILDNELCRQPTGDWGGQGTVGLTSYMGDPAPLDPRYLGNVMYVQSTDRIQQFPAHNYSTTVPFTYVNPGNGDYQALVPDWMDTSDGTPAGVDMNALNAAMNP